tara:strand:- start:2408 stop:2521 length:114 start_codon:yes stop_codon:yes gene_type:complete
LSKKRMHCKVCEEYMEDCICDEIPYVEDVEDESEGLR